MSVVSNNILAGSSGQGGAAAAAYEIERSLRFNSADTARLSRTPSSAGNRKTWTWSGWVKRSNPGTIAHLFNATGYALLYFYSDDKFTFDNGGASNLTTSQVFRDSSAWYHLILAFDTTQATASNRTRLYINGAQVTNFSTATYPAQNTDYAINNTGEHKIGNWSTEYANCYLADVHFIDGQALAPTNFGLTDDNGVWQPKKYTGSYGTNGFHLEFKNNSSNAALGTDTSGNNNTWTVNNLVATAGLETANQGFDAVTYTGTASTQSITGLAFQPDFVWLKRRNGAGNHNLQDVVRGASAFLQTDSTGAESSSGSRLASFDSNGFTVTSDNGGNASGGTYIGWAWKAGGAASSNTDGTVTSSVSANTSYGFSIVSFTVGSTPYTVGHGLGSIPKLIIMKSRTGTTNWNVYHDSTGNQSRSYLNLTNAASSGESCWNNTSPTSSVFSMGSSGEFSGDMVAYCWSEISGFSKFGSYSGSGSSGKKVTTGFKPRFVLVKRTTNISGSHMGWSIVDSERGSTQKLQAQSSAQENDGPINAASPNDDVTFNNDGFTLASGGGTSNASGETYIYAAFADKPPGEIIDSFVDTPTNADTPTDTGVGGEVKGNYCVLNVLHNDAALTISNGNLEISTSSANNWHNNGTTMAVQAGEKSYCEVTILNGNSSDNSAIVELGVKTINSSIPLSDYLGQTNESWEWQNNSGIGHNNSFSSYASGATYATNDVIGIAVDLNSGTLKFYKNGTDLGTAFTNLPTDKGVEFACALYGSSKVAWNFGQRPFTYQNAGTNRPSTDFKCLCSANLPDPTISDPSQYFDTKLYTGNASSNTISGLNFAPDFLWLKSRGSAQSHALFDLVRGSGQRLQSSATSAEDDYSSFFTGFTSDGFTLNQSSGINLNNDPLVAWAWDAGTSTVTNNNGSIASQVRANPSAGFSVVSFTASGTAGSDSCGHGLNVVPGMVIIKRRDGADDWYTWHSSFSNAQRNYILLNSTAAVALSGNDSWGAGMTSSVIGFRSQGTAAGNMIAYCFAPVEGYSAFGSYTGNGSADGPFVYTGFRPRYLLVKCSSAIGRWIIRDTARDESNTGTSAKLAAELAENENNSGLIGLATQTTVDFLSNGFKVRSDGGNSNDSTVNYIYIAFAENPFKTARAR